MKRKITALCVIIAMLAVAIIGGTMAYFTDTDDAVNVMTMGNIDIRQNEEERAVGADGMFTNALTKFTQNKPLFPAVYTGEYNFNETVSDTYTNSYDTATKSLGLWADSSLTNEIDKIITVTNTGKSDAYVRTLLAFELPMDSIAFNMNENVNPVKVLDADGKEIDLVVTISGAKYAVYCITYENALAAGDTTEASLLQFAMRKETTQEQVASIGEYYEIFAYTQAVQTAGFSSAAVALDEAFGAITADNHPWVNMPDNVESDIAANDNVLTLKDGETVRLIGYDKPLTVEGDGTVVFINADITAESGNALTVKGTDVKVKVEGVNSFVAKNGSGIGGDAGAVIDISGSGTITAVGNDVAGFGIGGEVSKVTIKDVTIAEAIGAYADADYTDYGKEMKDAPEGGAAIGSSYNGAVITLDNVVVENALGGSKSAGIGAKYWTAVEINITDSVIKNVVGGLSAAGIGGSRIQSGDATNQDVTINITDSTITAMGGRYGAGIGSGYDTYCHDISLAPIHTINIKGNSVINAVGGEYSAGIGTGYHCAGLDGEIETTVTVNATAGAGSYKPGTYTAAQTIGFGIVDPTREATEDNKSSINYKGTEITIPTP